MESCQESLSLITFGLLTTHDVNRIFFSLGLLLFQQMQNQNASKKISIYSI